jgi:FMN phosphatase YigB (HAD superfamily)
VFEYVLEKLAPAGVDKRDVLHTAQSQYHDIVPASELGFATMWIERRRGKGGFGATPRPQRIVGSAGSVLSIGSAGSILNIGGAGSGSRTDREEPEPEEGR